MLDPQQTEKAIVGLRAAYAAFNRGDIDAAEQLLDPNVEWTEPTEFPGGGPVTASMAQSATLPNRERARRK